MLLPNIQHSAFNIQHCASESHRDPEEPAAHVSDCLALLPSGPDAVRRLRLHRVRIAVRPDALWLRPPNGVGARVECTSRVTRRQAARGARCYRKRHSHLPLMRLPIVIACSTKLALIGWLGPRVSDGPGRFTWRSRAPGV